MPATNPFYLYAFVPLDTPPPDVLGLHDAELTTIDQNDVRVLVSRLPPGRTGSIRPQRRFLAAHQRVVAAVLESQTPLPVAFGTVAEETAIRRLVMTNHEPLIEQLAAVRDRVEMTFKLSIDAETPFEHLMDREPQLRAQREAIMARGTSRDEAIEMGRLLDRALQHCRAEHEANVTNTIEQHGMATKPIDHTAETELISLACLIHRASVEKFDGVVAEIARHYDDRFRIVFSGPWAPHHFVELRLDLSALSDSQTRAAA